MRVAIVHDWLTTWAGAEMALQRLLYLLPDADLYASIDILPAQYRDGLHGRVPRTTALQRLPKAVLETKYRTLLPLMPLAIKSWDFSAYDLILSSSHAIAKGITVPAGVRHLCYCYSPMRYAWDLENAYLETSDIRGVKAWLARRVLSRLRAWDRRTSDSVTEFIAISSYISERIRRCYGRDSIVVYPPVDTQRFTIGSAPRSRVFVTAGRIVQYKRVDLLVDAFRQRPDDRLIVIGDGPARETIEATAPANVQFTGRLPFDEMRAHMQSARAFLFAADEDFGIAPLEAQACGTPVIAYGRGGATETIRGLDAAQPTGVFFAAQTPHAVLRALAEFEANEARFSADACRANAERFTDIPFDRGILAALDRMAEPSSRRAAAADSAAGR